MNIKIVTGTISLAELKEVAKEFYDPMVKGVVDIEKRVVAFGGEYHADANNVLIEAGSKQSDVWGFNVHLDQPRESWIEYTSLINIRPAQGNRTIEVEDQAVRDKMKEIIEEKIT
jgi:hypothetical protein